MIRLVTAVAFAALVARAAAGATNVCEATAYIAPVNQLIFRMVSPGGGVREFERVLDAPGSLRGADGWSGIMGEGGLIDVESPDGTEKYRFDRGRLVVSDIKGEKKAYKYDMPRTAPAGAVSPLCISKEQMQDAAREYSYKEFLHKWDGTGRLAFPFVNPNQNGALYGELLVLFVFAVLFTRSRGVKIVAAAMAAAAAGCLFWTMSRGAWLGTALALMPFSFDRFRSILRKKAFWIGAASCMALVAAWVFFFGAGQLVRGFETGGWTNAIRIEIWKNAPRMMFDAPGGWGFFHVGSAYLHWYQPLHVFALTPTLINDHLTWLVGWGWVGRFIYLLAVYFVFAFSFAVWKKRGNPLSLSLWTVLFVSAWFNPMLHRVALWVLPVAVFAFISVLFPWRTIRVLAAVVVTTVLAAAFTVVFLYCRGQVDSERTEGILADASAGRVMYRAFKPRIWIVDDGLLGGGLAGKDIREFYSVEKTAPALGYVTSISALPPRVEKLVLSGHAGADWLTLLSENPSAREKLPGTVVFISPPFAPADIPEGVRKMCRAVVLTGEFAALYEPRFLEQVEGVATDIVPGMEQYVLQWMWRVMGY